MWAAIWTSWPVGLKPLCTGSSMLGGGLSVISVLGGRLLSLPGFLEDVIPICAGCFVQCLTACIELSNIFAE